MGRSELPKAIVPIFVLFGLTAIGLYALLEARPWQAQIITTGCVSDFEQVDHPEDHHIVDTYFIVRNQTFHLNSGYWTPGYKADLGAAGFKNGDTVKVVHRGNHVVDVSRLSTTCP